MSRHSRWLVHLLLAAAIGTGAATGAVVRVHHDRDAQVADLRTDALVDSDRYQEVLGALRDDGVHVTDDGRYLLDAEGEAAVEAAVVGSDTPVYVLVQATGPMIGADPYVVVDELTSALESDLAEGPGPGRGILYIWEGPGAGDVVELGESGYSSEFGSPDDFVGDPATTLPRAVAAVDDISWYDYDSSESDEWGGLGGGGFLGLLIAGGIVGGFLLVGRIVRKGAGRPRLFPGHWGWGEDERR